MGREKKHAQAMQKAMMWAELQREKGVYCIWSSSLANWGKFSVKEE